MRIFVSIIMMFDVGKAFRIIIVGFRLFTLKFKLQMVSGARAEWSNYPPEIINPILYFSVYFLRFLFLFCMKCIIIWNTATNYECPTVRGNRRDVVMWPARFHMVRLSRSENQVGQMDATTAGMVHIS